MTDDEIAEALRDDEKNSIHHPSDQGTQVDAGSIPMEDDGESTAGKLGPSTVAAGISTGRRRFRLFPYSWRKGVSSAQELSVRQIMSKDQG